MTIWLANRIVSLGTKKKPSMKNSWNSVLEFCCSVSKFFFNVITETFVFTLIQSNLKEEFKNWMEPVCLVCHHYSINLSHAAAADEMCVAMWKVSQVTWGWAYSSWQFPTNQHAFFSKRLKFHSWTMSFPPDGHGLIYFPAETPFGKYAVFFLASRNVW